MGITLRAVNEDDLEMIMRWRMDPDITRYMNTNPRLTLEGQKIWLASINSNDNVKNWVIEVNNIPAGLINLSNIDWEKKTVRGGIILGKKILDH